ncbi:thiamine pyrophosphate-binding protein, partial [Ferrimicrobium acidiphilum]
MSDLAAITGAQHLVASLVDLGVEYVFTNPGTTELELVQALEANEDLTPVLVTQELVATAAADGFARFRGLGVALLHLGPGFSNGAAFVHDARRAGTPMLVIVGEHPDTHLAVDAALNTDLAAIMAPFCVEVLVVDDPATVAQTTRRAGELARLHRGPVGLIAPQNVMAAHVCRDELGRDEPGSNESGREESVQAVAVASSQVVGASVAQSSRLLDQAVRLETSSTAEASGPTKDEVGHDPLLLLGSTALSGASQLLAARIASHIGARLYAEVFPAVMERGSHLPPISRIPYFPDQARAMIGTPSMVILIGTSEPLAYFAQEEMAPQLIPAETKIVT